MKVKGSEVRGKLVNTLLTTGYDYLTKISGNFHPLFGSPPSPKASTFAGAATADRMARQGSLFIILAFSLSPRPPSMPYKLQGILDLLAPIVSMRRRLGMDELQKIVVSVTNSRFQIDPRLPTESEDSRAVHQLARGAVRFGCVPNYFS